MDVRKINVDELAYEMAEVQFQDETSHVAESAIYEWREDDETGRRQYMRPAYETMFNEILAENKVSILKFEVNDNRKEDTKPNS